jgi:hypothetical protein
MISIVKLDQIPAVQTHGKRQVLKLMDATRYTDGNQDYVWLSFENKFDEKTQGVSLEITQFNMNQEIIEKVVLNAHDFICKSKQVRQLKLPLPIQKLTASISVKVLGVDYDDSHLVHDVFQPLLQPLPVKLSKRKLKKPLVKIKVKQKASWVLTLTWFLLAITTIIIVTVLQFGFI